MSAGEYRSDELFGWLEPLLTDAEYQIGLRIEREAVVARLDIPVGGVWP